MSTHLFPIWGRDPCWQEGVFLVFEQSSVECFIVRPHNDHILLFVTAPDQHFLLSEASGEGMTMARNLADDRSLVELGCPYNRPQSIDKSFVV